MIPPRIRVISDNDYSGDPDGLFQLAHLLLSPSADIRLVIGSHLRPGDPFDPSTVTADNAKAEADKIIELVGLAGRVRTVAGSNSGLVDRATPIATDAARAIVDEAMSDSELPLFVTLGGGLTELASAYLIEPRIADRLTAVWIGGPEHPGLGTPPPDPDGPSEYNTRIDIAAAQVVFDSPIPLWQVPRNAYRQAVVSTAELDVRVRPCGRIGGHLVGALDRGTERWWKSGQNLGETYILGDNPLVLLTALQTAFQPDPASSDHLELPAPALDDHGDYVPRPGGRPMRVYARLDARLMFEDLYAKLGRFGH